MRQEEKRNRVEQAIRSFYEEKSIAPHLVESVLYSIQAGGKRLRPMLLLELLEAFGQELTEAHFQVAGALEMIHTGSLIHDDLPAMDNDDYRRGQLTNHKKFGEDLAILAGDALFLDPFGMIAASDLSYAVKVSLILELSDASGSRGMVAGQVLDMEGEHKQLTLAELQTIHANKTGRLLAYPFIAAASILELQADIGQLLETIGKTLGLAFQVRDDILDLVADFEALGKTPQKDLVAEKSTYPALLGLEESKALLTSELDVCENLLDQMTASCDFDPQAIKKLIEGLRIDG
ncbi:MULTISPECIES: polyprenyl synthetase family protein [unclassified Streptococcus]|uniref:polyprenyl synthetase family protein n=1 Tax=Streptococcus TaxID=1301 RepID=UPI0020C8EC0F|nr:MULTISPECIES: farnesyl diphosphate synthase [unclassified Streptococcus]MCP8963044.1 polyprenyl synthetase family protein [Streptococcus sp. CF8_St5-12]MCP8980985.1 polyprenyl synthetase family protein [Streptococcus sp. CF8_St5-16]MCP8982834.1 polyprenyl synthetase family protein [Streptococcus sp. CF8_St5-13]MCP9039536.1 polyprenyl synthetase family protein [Streptococcus sp. CF8_St5-11]